MLKKAIRQKMNYGSFERCGRVVNRPKTYDNRAIFGMAVNYHVMKNGAWEDRGTLFHDFICFKKDMFSDIEKIEKGDVVLVNGYEYPNVFKGKTTITNVVNKISIVKKFNQKMAVNIERVNEDAEEPDLPF